MHARQVCKCVGTHTNMQVPDKDMFMSILDVAMYQFLLCVHVYIHDGIRTCIYMHEVHDINIFCTYSSGAMTQISFTTLVCVCLYMSQKVSKSILFLEGIAAAKSLVCVCLSMPEKV
jgi:hypothetical protein